MIPDAQTVLDHLLAFQRAVRETLILSRLSADPAGVSRSSSADTIYEIDAQVEPLIESFFHDLGRQIPLVLISEGLQDETGNEVAHRIFPAGTAEADAALRIIIDPIDGTRGLMYDKRSAWSLAGIAENKGPATRLRDIEIAAMTELPTSKMGRADVLWALLDQGAFARRVDLATGESQPLAIFSSTAAGIDHGFASISNFFPGTKMLASELMEQIAHDLIGPADVTRATVFDDQYISTGGQFYELIVGHDRFNADLRPIFYAMQKQPDGLCCHPYDCAAWLIAAESGVILTDALGGQLDGPMDTTTGISWAGYANAQLHRRIEPILQRFLAGRMAKSV